MADKTFNLLDEAWIRVVYPDCREDEVSLKQVFAGAHTYTDLAGEMPTQNVAMLRLLLAVLHAVFYRVDENGNPAEIKSAGDAYRRWQALWKMGYFPTEPIDAYLEKWRDRFDLLDEKRPFYQVPEVKKLTNDKTGFYTAAKLNGELSKSGNKERLFSSIAGEAKETMSYAEAARWLIFINAFDDMANKKSPKAKEMAKQTDEKLTTTIAWVGTLGNILAKGQNLFETLMLNFVLLDENSTPWVGCCPVWERDEVDSEERAHVAIPENQAELLTFQSRKILLKQKNGKIAGYYLVSGDRFDSVNAFSEQMTIWAKKKKKEEFYPKAHERNRKMWQDFSGIASFENGSRVPGVVDWNRRLLEKKVCNETMISYRIVGARYDSSQSSSITDTFEDSLTFHMNLLSELNREWIGRITDEIGNCEKISEIVSRLSEDIDKAAGGDGFDAKKGASYDPDANKRAKKQFYYRIDMPFRRWLQTLDSAQSDVQRDDKVREWRDTAYQIAARLGKELVNEAGPVAFRGKEVTGKKNKNSKTYYCAPDAYRHFLYSLNKYHPMNKKDEGGK